MTGTRRRLTGRPGICSYAFMRTTVVLPPDLMRTAKARSAERGESLKALITRAVAAEVAAPASRATGTSHVRLPLFGEPGGPKVALGNRDLAAALAEADAAALAHPAVRRRRFRKHP